MTTNIRNIMRHQDPTLLVQSNKLLNSQVLQSLQEKHATPQAQRSRQTPGHLSTMELVKERSTPTGSFV